MEPLAGFGRTQSALLRLLLRSKKGLTIDQIAQGLAVTRTAVNQHLASLERDGYIRRNDDAVSTGGRPSRLYALNDRGLHLFPKNYDLFSTKTLEALIDALGPDKARETLERLGQNLGADIGDSLKGRPLAEKMQTIVDVLEDLGFDAEEERTAPGKEPSIVAYNCVYHALAQANPDVCALDLSFLRTASGAKVEHAACMAKGDNECRFRFSGAKDRR